MSAGTAVPLEEYLTHTYQPDSEYVDGRLVERNVGEFQHSRLMATLGAHLLNLQDSTRLMSCRMRVSERRYRVPDLCAIQIRRDQTPIIEEPPSVVIEILSTEDRSDAVVQKCADSEAFGVPEIWIVDPHTKEVWTVRDHQAIPVPDRITSFTCAEGTVPVDFNEVFANLNMN